MVAKSILLICVLMIGDIGSAIAQTANPAQPQTSGSSGRSAVAPVTHRQPRAAEAPTTNEDSQASPLRENKDDETMNRIIRGICRGC